MARSGGSEKRDSDRNTVVSKKHSRRTWRGRFERLGAAGPDVGRDAESAAADLVDREHAAAVREPGAQLLDLAHHLGTWSGVSDVSKGGVASTGENEQVRGVTPPAESQYAAAEGGVSTRGTSAQRRIYSNVAARRQRPEN